MCVLNKRGKADFTVENIYTNISEGTAFHDLPLAFLLQGLAYNVSKIA